MAEHLDKTPDRKSQAAGHKTAQPQGSFVQELEFGDNRMVGVMQRKLQEVADGKPIVDQPIILQKMAFASSPQEPIQLNLGFDGGALPNPPFYRLTNALGHITRAPWVGHWANGSPATVAAHAAGQARNHVIGYHHIAESLTNLLNDLYEAYRNPPGPPTPATVITHLRDTTDALFHLNSTAAAGGAPLAGLSPEYQAMVNHRNLLLATIAAIPNYNAPLPGVIANLGAQATTLESDLISSPENVRAGDAGMNLRVQENIDADYGPLVQLPPAPAVGAAVPVIPGLPAPIPAPWLLAGNWGATALMAAALVPGNSFYVLTAPSNNVAYRFIEQHGYLYLNDDVSIVRNDDPANMVPGYTADAPISSGVVPPALPAGVLAMNVPVIVFDPTGVNLPHRYG